MNGSKLFAVLAPGSTLIFHNPPTAMIRMSVNKTGHLFLMATNQRTIIQLRWVAVTGNEVIADFKTKLNRNTWEKAAIKSGQVLQPYVDNDDND